MVSTPFELVTPGWPGMVGVKSSGVAPVDPTTLFKNAETGGVWDPRDSTTVFQDSAKTTAAVDGDVLGGFVDKVNGNTLTQATATQKPILHTDGTAWWWTHDGVDDYLQATFTHAQPHTRISLLRPNDYTSLGDCYFDGLTTNSSSLWWSSASTPTEFRMWSGAGLLAPRIDSGVWGTSVEIYNGASSELRINNNSVTGDAGSTDAGGLTVGTFGGINTNNMASASYKYILDIGRVLTANEIAGVLKFLQSL